MVEWSFAGEVNGHLRTDKIQSLYCRVFSLDPTIPNSHLTCTLDLLGKWEKKPQMEEHVFCQSPEVTREK